MTAQPATCWQSLEEIAGTEPMLLSVGLDPQYEMRHPFFAKELCDMGPEAFLIQWATTIMEASIAAGVRIFKPQSAYFEAFGHDGIKALHEIIKRMKSLACIVILDAKRGDIGSTMQAYGRFAFDYLGADVLTVNPYLGFDTLAALGPWLTKGHGVYAVLLTSNSYPGSLQEQMLNTGGDRHPSLVEHFLNEMEKSPFAGSIGFVVGAQRVQSIPPPLRQRMNQYWWLVPGLGAQGGEITQESLGVMSEGRGWVIPSSRAICGDFSRADSQFNHQIGHWKDYGLLIGRQITKFRCEELQSLQKSASKTV
jgi:orotidine-5'-phosphate decarboxylase